MIHVSRTEDHEYFTLRNVKDGEVLTLSYICTCKLEDERKVTFQHGDYREIDLVCEDTEKGGTWEEMQVALIQIYREIKRVPATNSMRIRYCADGFVVGGEGRRHFDSFSERQLFCEIDMHVVRQVRATTKKRKALQHEHIKWSAGKGKYFTN